MSRSGSPRVTIGMPVRNGREFVREALESLLAQDFGDFELLLSDNASTDGTADAATEVARGDDRVSVVRHERATAAEVNFNSLLPRAGGGYFLWAACDDRWEPTFIGRMVRTLDADADCAVAFSAFDNVSNDGTRTVRVFPPQPEFAARDRMERLSAFISADERAGKANLIYGMYRRKPLLAAGGIRAWGLGNWGADMLSVFRMLSTGRVGWADDVLFHKRLSRKEEAVRAATTPVPLRDLPEWHGYLSGYLRIVATLPDLPLHERRRLAAVVLRKLAAGDGAALRHVRSRLVGTT